VSYKEVELSEIEKIIKLSGIRTLEIAGVTVYQNEKFCIQNIKLNDRELDKLLELKLT
jgi:hypothetical protein